MMPITVKEIHEIIISAIPDAKIEITDLAGDGDHYQAIVESALFVGLPLVGQHQMVYNAFKGRMGTDLHALALKTLARK